MSADRTVPNAIEGLNASQPVITFARPYAPDLFSWIAKFDQDAMNRGSALNVNGDDAAAAIAAALEAEELLLVADVDGVRGEDGEVIQSLSADSASELIANGVAGGGMVAKLESATAALGSGVNRVKVCSLSGITDAASGTLIIQPEGVTT